MAPSGTLFTKPDPGLFSECYLYKTNLQKWNKTRFQVQKWQIFVGEEHLKFCARVHSPGIRALISCQNRQNGTPQNPLKGELLATTQLLVGQLGPQCLGNKPPSARHSPSRRNRARQMTIFDLNFWIVKSSLYLPEKNFSYIICKILDFFRI